MHKIAVPVLRHRLSTNFQAQAEGMTTEDGIQRLLKEIPEPEIPKFAQQATPQRSPFRLHHRPHRQYRESEEVVGWVFDPPIRRRWWVKDPPYI